MSEGPVAADNAALADTGSTPEEPMDRVRCVVRAMGMALNHVEKLTEGFTRLQDLVVEGACACCKAPHDRDGQDSS